MATASASADRSNEPGIDEKLGKEMSTKPAADIRSTFTNVEKEDVFFRLERTNSNDEDIDQLAIR